MPITGGSFRMEAFLRSRAHPFSRLRANTSPEWIATACAAMARPNPFPGSLPNPETPWVSTRKNGWKMVLTCSSGTPHPRSHMEITAAVTTSLRCLPSSTSTTVPAVVKRVASRMMFSNALRNVRSLSVQASPPAPP